MGLSRGLIHDGADVWKLPGKARALRSLMVTSCLGISAFASGEASAATPKATDGGAGAKAAAGKKAPKAKAERVPDGPLPTPSPKRTLPTYRGREGEPESNSALLWVPRIALSPLYLVSEYLIRQPMGWLVTSAEKKKWPEAVASFFTFGPDQKSGFVPTFHLDFGFRPSVGLFLFFDDAFADGNDLRFHGATWGKDWISLTAADRINLNSKKTRVVTTRAFYEKRKDWLFYGIGPRSPDRLESRFFQREWKFNWSYEHNFGKKSNFRTFAGVHLVDYDPNRGCCSDPTVAQRAANGDFAVPEAIDTGFGGPYYRVELELDSRTPTPANQTGVRAEFYGEHGSDFRASGGRSWARFGSTLGGFYDIAGIHRTLSLDVNTQFAQKLSGNGDIPFTENVRLGGDGPMEGYRLGRLNDRSSAVATVRYSWPIWVALDGTAFVSTGNVFGKYLEEFDTNLLRLSTGMGFKTVRSSDHYFQFLVAVGTETIEDGMEVSSVRILFGGARGF